MRTSLVIALAAATALSSPAMARDHGHHHGDGHREHHDHDRGHHNRQDYGGYRYGHYDNGRHRGHDRHRIYVGYRLPRVSYGPQYFVNDYGRYGLRAPGRHLRWIRYGDELLLVDVRRGIVVEVIPDRFY